MKAIDVGRHDVRRSDAETIAVMRKAGRWMAITAVALLCLILLTPHFIYFVMPWLMVTISPFMTKPPGLPPDAVASHDFKIGTFWQYCRDLPSGRAIVGPRGVALEFGARCGWPVSYIDEPDSSLDRPGMRVAGERISFSVPPVPSGRRSSPCPYDLGPSYRLRATSLLKEAMRIPELDSMTRQRLATFYSRLADATVDRLALNQLMTDTQSCELDLTQSLATPPHLR